MCDSDGKAVSMATEVEPGIKSITLPTPVPKPRPAVKPAVPPKSSTIGTKPVLKPKPAARRKPPSIPNTTAVNTTNGNRNEDSISPPKRPVKPRHLKKEKLTSDDKEEKEQSSELTEKAPANGIVLEGNSDSVEGGGNEEDDYDDVESIISDQSSTSGDSQQVFHPAKRKESGGTMTSPTDESSKPQPVSRPKPKPPKKPLPQFIKPLPSRPPPSPTSTTTTDLPQTSVAALAQKLQGVPMFPVTSSDSKTTMTLTPTTATAPAKSPRASPLLPSKVNHSLEKEAVTKPDAIPKSPIGMMPSAKDQDEPHRKISDTVTQKKRIASRRQLPPPVSTTEVPIPLDPRKRRPPPPPPTSPGIEEQSPTKGTLQGPPVPYNRRQDNIRNSAEDQSLYSYAYEHTPFAPPQPNNNHATQPTPEEHQDDIVYTEPSAEAVTEFMDDLNSKSCEVSSAEYEVPAEDSVNKFMESVAVAASNSTQDKNDSNGEDTNSGDEHDYIYPAESSADDVKEEDEDSSSSFDSEHDYEMPPEEVSPPPSLSPSNKCSGSYDVTDAANDDLSSDDDQDRNYIEPIEEPTDTAQELDTFLDDMDDGDDYEEPLYQVYAARTLERDRTLSRNKATNNTPEMSLDDLTQGTLRNMRMLWCELPEVTCSGVLDTIDPTERKRQEAMFEVITSEASYLKSLTILVSHFVESPELQSGNPQSVLEKAQQKVLFSNVKSVLDVSERFLGALRERQRQSTVISTISDIIEDHATKYFDVYVKYCSLQIYMDRTLKELRKNLRFVEAIEKLERCSTAQSLTLQSFLVLPMQRITRLPLLVDAICHRCEEGSDDFFCTDVALKAVNKVVYECNEGARKMERMEEIIALQPLIEFTVKPIALVSSNRWLLRRGEVLLASEEYRSPIRKKLKQKPVYMFLFNDLLLICKKKSDMRYRVLDYGNRSMIKIEEANEPGIQMNHMLSLILLENSNGKTKDFLMCADSETDKTRWLEAFMPPKAELEGEKVYGAWDCPQVQAIHNYTPKQPDELALHEGDVINVRRKLLDGWYHGERLCDGVHGWFPANHTESIRNEHVRARNLLQRYRLLAASKHLIGATQTMSAKSKTMKSVKGILSS